MKLLLIAALALCLHIPMTHAFDDCQQSVITNTIITSIASALFGYGLAKIADQDEPVSTRIGTAISLAAMTATVVACTTYVTVHYECPTQSTTLYPR